MTADKIYYLAVRALISSPEDRYLLLRRSKANKALVGLWEIPGGKADPGESIERALRREVREETGLELTLGGVLGAYGVEMPDKRLAIVCLRATVVSGTLTLSDEHDAYIWSEPSKIFQYQFVDGFREFLQKNL